MAYLLFNLHARRRPRQFTFRPQPLDDFTDEQLRSRYRFGKASLRYIENLVQNDLRRQTRRNNAIPPLYQLLMALRFYASGSFLQVIGDTFRVDKATVSRAVTDVSKALVNKRVDFIKWPTNDDELKHIKSSFFRRGGFPGVIGCVDGTHIRIQAPHNNENGYVNRKGYHSINVQGICDNEGTSACHAYIVALFTNPVPSAC